MRLLTAVGCLVAALPALAETDLLRYVPPDVRMVGGINVVKARESAAFKTLMGGDAVGWGVSGISLLEAREVVFATQGSRGRKLAVARIEPLLDPMRRLPATGAVVQTYAGTEILAIGDSMAAAKLEDGIVAFGHPDAVRAAIDRKNTPGEVAAEWTAARSRGDAWFTTTAPLSEWTGVSGSKTVDGIMAGDVFKKLTTARAFATFGADVAVTAEAAADTPQNAAALADVARFLFQAAKASKSAEAQMVKLLDGFEATADQSTTRVTFTIVMTKVKAEFDRMAKRMSPQ